MSEQGICISFQFLNASSPQGNTTIKELMERDSLILQLIQQICFMFRRGDTFKCRRILYFERHHATIGGPDPCFNNAASSYFA